MNNNNNIFNKEDAMKRKHSYFLRNSLRAGMPAVTAALLTFAGLAFAAEKSSAAAPAQKTPAAPKVTTAPAVQKPLSAAEKLTATVLAKLNLVKQNNGPGRYVTAFKEMEEIDKLIAPTLKLINGKACPPPYLAVAYEEYSSLLPEIRMGAAEEYFKTARELFQIGLKDPKVDPKIYDKAKTFAYDALAIYYCGKKWAALGNDPAVLDAALVGADKEFHKRVRTFIDNCDLRASGQSLNLLKKIETVKLNELDRATQLIAQADMLASPETKKYRDALIRLQEAKGYLFDDKDIVRSGNKVTGLARIWIDKFDQVRKLHGEELFTQARELHAQALKLGATAAGVAKAEEAEQRALEARTVYYLGKFSNQVTDAQAVNKQINHLNQSFSIDIEEFIRSCKKIANAKKFADETDNTKIDPNFANRQREISTLYTQAEKMYRDKQYSKARDLCEQIFLKDPLNQRAIRLLDKVYKKLYYYSELRVFNEMRKNDAETVWSWVPQIVRHDNPNTASDERAPGSEALLDKLNNIKISVNFKGLTLSEVIDSISHKTRNADPTQQGINIIIKGMVDNSKKVTLENIKDMPVSKVLDYIVAELGVGWSITDNWIITIGNDVQDYETREFPLRKSAYSAITGKEESEDGEEEESDEDPYNMNEVGKGVAGQMAKQRMVTDDDLKAEFEKLGVVFDSNSVISYNNNEQKVFARNRRSELIKLEKLIREMDVESPMILVESKILEIALNDQEELGFDWVLSCDNNSNSSRTFNMSSPLRSSGFTNNIMLNSLNVVPNFHLSGSNLNLNLYLTITAVDRTDRMELLSTPKVVATNGIDAEVKMVRQEYFPESWNEPDVSVVSGDSGNIEFQPSYPEFGDATDVGISFNVTPTISENKKTIRLSLKPSVTDFTGWTDYSYEVAIIRGTSTEDDPPDALNPLYPNSTDFGPDAIWELLDNSEQRTKVRMMMPEISVREVETNVKVYDGQTLLIGGLIIDKHTTMEDRFPILGDLPLIGRLFTKSASATQRTNMLISVTTRLIYGDGSLYGESQPNGLPDFGR